MNLRIPLANLYPENSYGGQCGYFARQLVDILPVGNSYADKKRSVRDYGILAESLGGQYKIGDVIITNEGTNFWGNGNGHVAIINNIVGDNLYLTESNFNFKNKEKVSHGRILPRNSKKIYGILRKRFKFNLGITEPLEVVCTVFMNHLKQWNGKIFDELVDMIYEYSGGRLRLKIAPLYTYNVLKNWWYLAYGTSFGNRFYNVIAKEYIDQQVMPLVLPNTKFMLWCIDPVQWHGTVFNGMAGEEELGWYYFGSKPGQALVVCNENDKSKWYPEMKAFTHYAFHEMAHWLQENGNRRREDITHLAESEFNLKKIFSNIEWDFLYAQI